MLKSILILFTLFITSTNYAQSKPKLIVGIVVDQMRYDFLFKYEKKYGNGGFKRLIKEGFQCRNNHFNYVPTYTGPGHASVYTGTVPAIHGIIANNWYVRDGDKMIYCAEDNTVQTVGTEGKAGFMSPRNMLTTSICDQLRIAQNFKSKTIGIALKDRGAILPAGHTANAAYWFDGKSGNWISSTYYFNQLPKWVQDFNNEKWPQKYIANDWKTLLPIASYTESTSDTNTWEDQLKGESFPVFPHILKKENTESIRTSPFGNSLTKDFAKAAILADSLGKGNTTDFLAVSFSSTDYVGHAFGPNSIEVEDTYIRLDKDLEEFLLFLDKEIGINQYTVFLTADHGVADVPGFAKNNKLPGDILDIDDLDKSMDSALSKSFGAGKWILNHDNDQIFLNKPLLKEKNIELQKAISIVEEVLKDHSGIQFVVNLTQLDRAAIPSLLKERIINGYNQKRSGEIQYITEAGWIAHGKRGTTHGSAWNYDTHVPLLFFGHGIKKGQTLERTSISDIAPTIANLLNIIAPSGSIGQIIPVGN